MKHCLVAEVVFEDVGGVSILYMHARMDSE